MVTWSDCVSLLRQTKVGLGWRGWSKGAITRRETAVGGQNRCLRNSTTGS